MIRYWSMQELFKVLDLREVMDYLWMQELFMVLDSREVMDNLFVAEILLMWGLFRKGIFGKDLFIF